MPRYVTTPISKLPWGFLGTIALIVLVERGVLRLADRLAGYEGFGVRFALDAAEREAPGCKVLSVGDSVVKFGFDPATLEDRLGLGAYNLGVPGTPPPLAYALFQRALDAGAKPKVLVVSQMSLAGHSRAHVAQFGEFARVGECLALAWSNRELSLLGALISARVLPSYRYRNGLRAGLQGGLIDLFAEERRRDWAAHRGAELRPPDVSLQGRMDPEAEKRLISQPWEVDAVFEQYLRRLTDLAHSRGIAVIWVIPPLDPQLQASRDVQGFDALHTRNIRAIHSRMSGVILLDARHSGYVSTDFFDAIHLNARGAARLSEEIAEVITERVPTLQARRSDRRSETR